MNQRILNHLGLLNPAATPLQQGESGLPVHEHVLPPKPPEMSWRDYLLMLLHVAAEIEHGLMVEYLYAAYSLGGDQVPPEHKATVKRWQNEIVTIAREEMGHMLSVQNLVTLLGGAVSFERRDFPWDTPFYPFPFRLEPVSLDSLACYVFAEMPPEDALDIKKWANQASGREYTDEDAKQIQESVFKQAGRRHPHHVAEIYNLIIEIVADPKRLAEADFRPESYPYQASWDDWGRGYGPPPTRPDGTKSDAPAMGERKGELIIRQAATRTEAISALKAVAGQGEAPHLREGKSDEPSHFARFLGVYQEFEEKVVKLKLFNPVRAVPCNPTTVPDAHVNMATTLICNAASKLWADLFNLRYRLLLVCLTHSFRLARRTAPGVDQRGAVLHRAFGEMYNLKTMAGLLMQLPLGEDGDGKRAGPPFGIPYTLELPLGEKDVWLMHLDLLKSAGILCEMLLNGEQDFLKTAPPAARNYLRTLRDLDRQTEKWIEQARAG